MLQLNIATTTIGDLNTTTNYHPTTHDDNKLVITTNQYLTHHSCSQQVTIPQLSITDSHYLAIHYHDNHYLATHYHDILPHDILNTQHHNPFSDKSPQQTIIRDLDLSPSFWKEISARKLSFHLISLHFWKENRLKAWRIFTLYFRRKSRTICVLRKIVERKLCVFPLQNRSEDERWRCAVLRFRSDLGSISDHGQILVGLDWPRNEVIVSKALRCHFVRRVLGLFTFERHSRLNCWVKEHGFWRVFVRWCSCCVCESGRCLCSRNAAKSF